MEKEQALRATLEIRAALEASEGAGGGSFSADQAVHGLCLCFETRGGGRLDQQLDQQGMDVMQVLVGFALDRWLEAGILEGAEEGRFRFTQAGPVPPASVH